MRFVLLIFFTVILLFSIKKSRGENVKFVEIGRQFLTKICNSLRADVSLKDCYESSLLFGEYLWVIAYIIEENKGFETQMVLPNGIIDNEKCMEINPQQCITMATFLINENYISVEYNLIDNITSPVISQCKLERSNLLPSLNILWMGNSNKISDLRQGVILGRGYQELTQFNDPFLDLSSIICHDVKMYLFAERYRKKLIAIIKGLIQDDTAATSMPIRNPVYVRIPLKYDQELDLSWLYCQDLPLYLRKLDGVHDQIKLDLRGKNIVINKKGIVTNCILEDNMRTKIIMWKIED